MLDRAAPHEQGVAVPGFLVLYDWRQLLVISNQDKSVGAEQRSEADGLANL